MKIELSIPQAEFFMSKSQSVAVVAGFGSGKTDIAKLRCITTMRQFPGCNQLYLAPTYPLIKDIWYPKVEEYLEELDIGYKINKQDHIIQLEGLGKMYCRTMEHPARIVGFEVLDAFLDELDVIAEDKALEVWRKTKARCRQKIIRKTKKGKYKKRFQGGGAPLREWTAKMNQMYVSTTPEGFKTTYNLFEGDPIPGSHLIQMSTYSNLHNLPPGYIRELRANYPSQLINAYIMGMFVNLVNKPVWHEYDKHKNNTRETVHGHEQLIVGMDFNVGRGCAVVYVERDEDDLHAVDEVYNSYDTPDTIRVLKERYEKNDITVFPDASGGSRKSVNATTSDIALLKQAGYAIKSNKKNPNIKDRVMATNRLFHDGNGRRRLYVNDKKCPKFSSSLIHQIYDNNGLPEKGTGDDDITDAGSYPVAHMYPIKKISTIRRELRI